MMFTVNVERETVRVYVSGFHSGLLLFKRMGEDRLYCGHTAVGAAVEQYASRARVAAESALAGS